MPLHRAATTAWRGVALVAIVALAPAPRRGLPRAAAGPQQDPLAEPFRGVTTDGNVIAGLFPIRATGVSTAPVRDAARSFLASLTTAQRAKTTFPVDDIEWRMWNNVHRAERQGTSLREMNDAQRDAAFGLLQAALSPRGIREARGIMRLNGYLADLEDNHDEYGDDLYFFTLMGTPSDTAPWGFQLEGHHLIINYFVLGDQVVMTPTFMGSEPVAVDTGALAGSAVLQDEQDGGLALMKTLSVEQRKVAVIDRIKTGNNAVAQAYHDNLVLDYAGIRARNLDAEQRRLLLDVIARFVGNMDDAHARIRMDEVRRHLDDTWFAWIGDIGPNTVFYYRIQSPVILIEFDHERPVALDGPPVPSRAHIHTVVRTPNGNDYGKDLLRQHYAEHENDPGHGHGRE